MTKGEKYQLNLEGLAFVFSSAMSGKTRLTGFANRTIRFCPTEFLSIFLLPCSSGLDDMLIIHVHVFWLYPILFMSYLSKYVCVNALKSLVYVFLSLC
jgi:hypothetical protein